jgi:chemotaxis protein MotB
MKIKLLPFLLLTAMVFTTSCVSKKKFTTLESERDALKQNLADCDAKTADYLRKLEMCNSEKSKLEGDYNTAKTNLTYKEEQVENLKAQIEDFRKLRDSQLKRLEDLTVLSTSANDNIKASLSQLEKKDEYIQMLQAAKNRTDSINLALAINLKGVLKDGLMDEDVTVQVDKTVVFINLSDKMLYKSGSASLTSRANEVLGKIASILKSKPGFEVMVEGYTDNVPISKDCIKDNWDLSVMRATSVVRVLQEKFEIDPNRLIAAGRGEYNALASNDTAEGRSTNRRTRIIIMPKLDQFYDLLNPEMAAEKID